MTSNWSSKSDLPSEREALEVGVVCVIPSLASLVGMTVGDLVSCTKGPTALAELEATMTNTSNITTTDL